MRVFEIFDTSKRGHRACATLEHDETSGESTIHINDDASPDDLPFMLAMFAEEGKRTIGEDWAKRWIAERVPPAGRQNIGEILRENGLEEYDEIALLVAGNGRSSQDDFQIREVGGHIDYAVVPINEGPQTLSDICARFGAQLASARKEAGITQTELAERTGIAQAVISRIEHGKGNPTVETLLSLTYGAGAELSVNIQ